MNELKNIRKVSNPILTQKALKLKIYELALSFQKEDTPPYSMCVCLKEAIAQVFFGVGRCETTDEQEEYMDEYIKKCMPEFMALKPKNTIYCSYWWDSHNLDVRMENFENLIKISKDE